MMKILKQLEFIVGSIRYNCTWRWYSSVARWLLESVVGANPLLTQHWASVTSGLPVYLPQVPIYRVQKGYAVCELPRLEFEPRKAVRSQEL